MGIVQALERHDALLLHLPGHSIDGIGVLVVEDRVLFSGDIMMPIPYLVDGQYEQMVESMKRLPKMKLENLIQGHGEVILRGEVASVQEKARVLDLIRALDGVHQVSAGNLIVASGRTVE